MKESISKAATLVDGRSHRCVKCPFHPCSLTMAKVCGDSFREGFRKGYEWERKQRKKNK